LRLPPVIERRKFLRDFVGEGLIDGRELSQHGDGWRTRRDVRRVVNSHFHQGFCLNVDDVDEQGQAGDAWLPRDVVVEDRQPVVEHHGVNERREGVDVLA
jgi:hypothetical protein